MYRSERVDPHSPEWTKELNSRGYTVGEIIGEGHYSTVYKAKKGDRDLALKVVNLQEVTDKYKNKFIPRELKLIQKVKHNNIIETVDVIKDPGRALLVFMQYAYSDLDTEIKKHGKIEENQAKIWLGGIAQALDYLHKLNYVHRDLKPANILIISDTQAVLSDFGFSKQMPNQSDLTNSHCGTVFFMAPEVLREDWYNPFAADVWSFGIVIYFTLDGKGPFTSESKDEFKKEQTKIRDILSKSTLPRGAKSLLGEMLTFNFKERAPMSKIAKHEWFKSQLPISPPLTPVKQKPNTESPKKVPSSSPKAVEPYPQSPTKTPSNSLQSPNKIPSKTEPATTKKSPSKPQLDMTPPIAPTKVPSKSKIKSSTSATKSPSKAQVAEIKPEPVTAEKTQSKQQLPPTPGVTPTKVPSKSKINSSKTSQSKVLENQSEPPVAAVTPTKVPSKSKINSSASSPKKSPSKAKVPATISEPTAPEKSTIPKLEVLPSSAVVPAKVPSKSKINSVTTSPTKSLSKTQVPASKSEPTTAEKTQSKQQLPPTPGVTPTKVPSKSKINSSTTPNPSVTPTKASSTSKIKTSPTKGLVSPTKSEQSVKSNSPSKTKISPTPAKIPSTNDARAKSPSKSPALVSPPLPEPTPAWSSEVTSVVKAKGYTISQEIARGDFTIVYKGTKEGKPVAVKVVDLQTAPADYRETFFPREASFVKNVNHPNIVQTFDVFIERNKRFFIFMELGQSSLRKEIDSILDHKIPEAKAKIWLGDVAKALSHLHSLNYCHRNLKPENILIRLDNHAMISDFGNVKYQPQTTALSKTFIGTVSYMSPQMVRKQPYSPFSSDVWSFGVIIFETICGIRPFLSQNRQIMKSQQKSCGEVVANSLLPNLAKNLVTRMMRYDEKERIPMRVVVRHPWFGIKMDKESK